MNALVREASLSNEEKLRVALATACGCLDVIHYLTPGPEHTKKKRSLTKLRETLIKQTGRKVPGIKRSRERIFTDHVRAADTILKELVKEQKNHINVFLNFALYCTKKLPISSTHYLKVLGLFEMWPEATIAKEEHLKDSGDKIFNRIQEQAQNYKIEREGLPLT